MPIGRSSSSIVLPNTGDMNKIALIRKFVNNRCTKEEAEEALKLLESHPELLDEVLDFQEFQETSPVIIYPKTESKIRENVFKSTINKPYVLLKRVFAAAAVLAGIFFTANYFLNNEKEIAPQVVSAPSESSGTKANELIAYHHQGAGNFLLTLNDESVVELFPDAKIWYAENFKENRIIYLEGVAVFNVKKNNGNRFTVFSGSVATTALGTKFLVRNIKNDRSVSVQLFEGKVVVEPAGEALSFAKTYLNPGQQCYIDLMLSMVEVNEISGGNKLVAQQRKEVKKVNQPVENDQLSFVKVPLMKVLDTLQKIYNTGISFNLQEINESNFTGIVSLKDPLEVSLKAIAAMQGYEIVNSETGYQLVAAEVIADEIPEIYVSKEVKTSKEKNISDKYPTISFNSNYVYQYIAESRPIVELAESGYTYNRIPLIDLFEILSAESGWEIIYNEEDVEGINFSGTLDYRESVNSILNIICIVNDLEYVNKRGKYFISRKKKK